MTPAWMIPTVGIAMAAGTGASIGIGAWTGFFPTSLTVFDRAEVFTHRGELVRFPLRLFFGGIGAWTGTTPPSLNVRSCRLNFGFLGLTLPATSPRKATI